MNAIAIDFDGVISDFTGNRPFDNLNPPVTGAIEAIRSYQDAGLNVVIYTTRAGSLKEVNYISQWLRLYGLENRRIEKIDITNKKPPAIVYLDDRGWLFTGSFPTADEIKAFKTWKGF
jgi:hypothetical protein